MRQQAKAGAGLEYKNTLNERQKMFSNESFQSVWSHASSLPLQLLYFVLCMIGLVISVLVMAFAAHHYEQTSSFICEQKAEACICILDNEDLLARTFTYEGVSDCEVITGTLTLYFLIQIFLNLAQALVCAVGAFIMWKHRYQVFFAGLQIGSPSTQQWQKV